MYWEVYSQHYITQWGEEITEELDRTYNFDDALDLFTQYVKDLNVPICRVYTYCNNGVRYCNRPILSYDNSAEDDE